MKQSEKIGTLAAALVAVQSELRGVAKDSTNPDFKSAYTSLDAIIAASRPVLTKHGLAVVQGATTPHSDETGKIAAVAVETMLVHTSGEWLSNTAIMPVVGRMLKGGGRADPDPQSGGSALTYGRRYGLAAILCLSTDEDDDGNRASRPKIQKAKPATNSDPYTGSGTVAGPTASGPVWPFGDNKGQPLTALSQEQLSKGLAWLKEKNDEAKFGKLIGQVEAELDARNG